MALPHAEQDWLHTPDIPPTFDGDFLRPFYTAAGLEGPLTAIWVELSAMGAPLPANATEAEAAAASFRASSLFDAALYGDRLPRGISPPLHYAVVGERLGWRPSRQFDPIFYLERYPDVFAAGLSPLVHFEQSGRNEARQPVSLVDQLQFPSLPADERPVALVICHEASRTGAPVLGWNLARLLARKARVVSLLLGRGSLEAHFVAVAAAAIRPLTAEERHPVEIRRLAEQIVREYRPRYAVANSIETHAIVPHLASLGVPIVALVHEFAAYTRPLAKMRDVYDWASEVVFPAELVARSSFDAFEGLGQRRGIHVLSQGRNDPPSVQDSSTGSELLAQLKSESEEETFLVLGCGTVQIRKGVDLFIAAAAAVRRLRPDLRFRFAWIGHGYDPDNDAHYSVYLAEQIAKSDLAGSLVMFDGVDDLEPAYAVADAFLMCSRLDPQPNVAIDAVTRGIPTVCFEGASGTAEVLAADAATRVLVVPHLDVHAAAVVLCDLAEDRVRTSALRVEVARVGRIAFDMEAYTNRVHNAGLFAAGALRDEDLATLAAAAIVEPEMALVPGAVPLGTLGAERQVLQQWAVMGLSSRPSINPHFRRPCAGFNPQVYALAHPTECGEGRAHPLAHWLRAGRPAGLWSRRFYAPANLSELTSKRIRQRVALHAHFYYKSLAAELAGRLARNETPCDLFLSTDTDQKAKALRIAFHNHRGPVEIAVVENRGRDVAPFLTGLGSRLVEGGYDLFGHIHGKRSLGVDVAMGEAWRHFLWETLVGGEYPMLDLATAVFARTPSVGLLMAEDPHLVSWDKNRSMAENLARRMGIPTPLDEFFDFPLGTMFWIRPAALRPLLDLHLGWKDYPSEPLPNDGTLLHAFERLMPFVVRKAGFEVAGMRVPGTTW